MWLRISLFLTIIQKLNSTELVAALVDLQKPSETQNPEVKSQPRVDGLNLNEPSNETGYKSATSTEPQTATSEPKNEESKKTKKSSSIEKERNKLKGYNTLPINPQMPLEIGVKLALESIEDISVDATFNLYMEQTWYDHRERNLTAFMSGKGTQDFCWTPDLYYLLARKVSYLSNTQYLNIDKGKMLFDRKVSVTLPCTPDPFRYPFDKVVCQAILSSYGYDVSSIRLHWKDKGVYFPEAYDKLEYIGFRWDDESPITIASEEVQYGEYNYTIITAYFKFNRIYTVYIYQVMIPAAILVIVSWSIFWINIDVTPARVGIGVTVILVLLTLSTNRKQDANSKLLNLKTDLLDIYIWSCFLFVIVAYIEVSVSDYMRTDKGKKISLGTRLEPITAKKVNVSSRILFPLAFAVFNLGYWSYVYYIQIRN